jgi:hypothetical protein
MTADNTIADVGNEARGDWLAERPDSEQPSRAELADVAPLGFRPWCHSCSCRHGHNDPWCTKEAS